MVKWIELGGGRKRFKNKVTERIMDNVISINRKTLFYTFFYHFFFFGLSPNAAACWFCKFLSKCHADELVAWMAKWIPMTLIEMNPNAKSFVTKFEQFPNDFFFFLQNLNYYELWTLPNSIYTKHRNSTQIIFTITVKFPPFGLSVCLNQNRS